MDSNDNKKDPRKVIDISERISARLASKNPLEKLKAMKVRLDLEQAKIAIPASLLSIIVVVSLVANSKLLNGEETVQSREIASVGTVIEPVRGIASVPTGTSQDEDQLVKEMASKALSDISSVGRSPSALEKLSLETLEGKYAIRMDEAQKISEIEISANQVSNPVAFTSKFIESNRSWMPVSFEKSIRIQNTQNSEGGQQSFHLVNDLSIPLARVDVRLDGSGRLLALKVIQTKATESK